MMGGPLILGLDPATKLFGWCLLREGVRLASGCWHLQTGSRTEPMPVRMARLHDHLIDLDNTVFGPVDVVAYELPHGSKNVGSLIKQGRPIGVVDAWIGKRDHVANEVVEFDPSTLKLDATGKGNASKADMIEAVRLRLGYLTTDEDEADACMVAWCAWQRVLRGAA